MNAEDGVILWLNRTGSAHYPLVGPKAAALGELVRAGFLAPDGFTVTTRSYQGFLQEAGLREPISRRLAGLSPDNPEKLLSASARLQRLVLQAKLPKDLAGALRSAHQRLGGGPLAVWADGVVQAEEPGGNGNYLLTQVNVIGDEGVAQALRAGWAAAFSPRSLMFLASLGLGLDAIAPAVTFQRMVDAEVSGILLTLDPIYVDGSRVVAEAVWGLNGVLNDARVTPEIHLLDKASGHPIARRNGEQDHKLVYNPSAARGEPSSSDVPLSDAEVGRVRLDERQLGELAGLARSAEAVLGVPAELEWAKVPGEDGFQVLQARPLQGFAPAGATVADHRGEMAGKLLLTGVPASPGFCSGKVRLVEQPSDTERVQAGDVVVLRGEVTGADAAVRRAGAVILDEPEAGVRTITLCEELGIPCVCGTGLRSSLLRSDQTVTVDGTWGRVLEGVVVVKAARQSRPHHQGHHDGPPVDSGARSVTGAAGTTQI